VPDHSTERSYGKSAHLYDLFDDKENVELFNHYASAAGEMLDVGAGTGRIAIPLAERGARLWCVEPSRAMRREFEGKLALRPDLAGRIKLYAGDARSFKLGRTFPAAMLSGTSDHFLDDEERVASLTNVAGHLSPGGVLVFDVFLGLMRDTPSALAGEVTVGRRVIRRSVGTRRDDDQMEVTLVYEVFEPSDVNGVGTTFSPTSLDATKVVLDGKRRPHLVERIEEHGWVGITTREGVHRALAEAGLELRQEFGDYDRRPFRAGDPLLIVDATKP
jgi:SAM-dependent methyltransferase